MKALIIGCGRFGVRVADYLTRNNHDVVVIDIGAVAMDGDPITADCH